MISLLATILVLLIFFGLIYYIATLLPLPPPFPLIVQVLVLVILLLVLLGLLLGSIPLIKLPL